jgi:uncharacterized membrane protein YkvA (DUF1232 family)
MNMKMPPSFARFLPVAERILARQRLPALLLAVARKSGKRGGRKSFKDNLQLLQALCLAWWRGEYRAISGKALLVAVAGLAYFLSPIDLIPDFILGVGLLDDVAVLAWIMRTWGHELEAFSRWREQQPAARRSQLERLPQDDEIRARSGRDPM